MRHLRRAIERELVARCVRDGEHRSRLDRAADQAVIDEVEPRDVRGLLHRLADGSFVAPRPAKADIAGRGLMQLRRVSRFGDAGIDHSRQGRIVDVEEFSGIERLLARLADDDGDRLADMAHALARKRPARRLRHRLAIGAADRPQRAHRTDMIGGHVGATEDGDDARRGRRPRRVDLAD